jgi:hypothetical protein
MVKTQIKAFLNSRNLIPRFSEKDLYLSTFILILCVIFYKDLLQLITGEPSTLIFFIPG